ncbi:MAG TPA: flagellar hook-associated protein FlgL [Balneolales bacterium]|nr:flagellar hook-associated protein FlgL [Balneolales bacterium]
MRITEQSYINTFLQNINRNRSEMAKLEEQLSTQKSVNQPSDNPTAYSDGRNLEAEVKRNQQYQTNIDTGLTQANSASDAMTQMQDELTKIKSIAVQGANGTLSQSDMSNMADNVDQLKQSLVELTNTQIQGRYLFGGTKSDNPPFSVSGNTVTYNGNSGSLNIKISDSSTVKVSTDGNNLIDYKSGDTIFKMLDRLSSSLRAGNSQGVSNELNNITSAVGHVSDLNGQLGNTINQMQFTTNQYDASNINLQSNISNLTDADYASVISQFQSLQTAYSAALTVHSQIMSNNLAKYM